MTTETVPHLQEEISMKKIQILRTNRDQNSVATGRFESFLVAKLSHKQATLESGMYPLVSLHEAHGGSHALSPPLQPRSSLPENTAGTFIQLL